MQLQAFSSSALPVSRPALQASKGVPMLRPSQMAARFGEAHEHTHHESKPEPQGFFTKLMQSVSEFLKSLFGKKTEDAAKPEPQHAHDHHHDHKHEHGDHDCGLHCPVHG
jgi:hypothetical protein